MNNCKRSYLKTIRSLNGKLDEDWLLKFEEMYENLVNMFFSPEDWDKTLKSTDVKMQDVLDRINNLDLKDSDRGAIDKASFDEAKFKQILKDLSTLEDVLGKVDGLKFEDLVNVPELAAGKIPKINPTGDGVIFVEPENAQNMQWGGLQGELKDQTDLTKYVTEHATGVNVLSLRDFTGKNINETQALLNDIFATTDYYRYYIPHTINYGNNHRSGNHIAKKLNLPDRDFIVIDDSVDNGYANPAHQGGQIRYYVHSSEVSTGHHNSFGYFGSRHHPGWMLDSIGNDVNPDGYLSRNATFFTSVDGVAKWGVGMGGNAVLCADPDNPTSEEELKAQGFKIVCNGYRGGGGLTNVFNINMQTGNWGFETGVTPYDKYSFGFAEGDNHDFGRRSYHDDNSFSRDIIANKANKIHQIVRTEKDIDFITPYNRGFKYLGENGQFQIKANNGVSSLELYGDSVYPIKFKNTGEDLAIYTRAGQRGGFSKEGNLSVYLGVSGGVFTTANRPNASLLENGTMIIDSDLDKIIWLKSNKSNTWRDAMGNVV